MADQGPPASVMLKSFEVAIEVCLLGSERVVRDSSYTFILFNDQHNVLEYRGGVVVKRVPLLKIWFIDILLGVLRFLRLTLAGLEFTRGIWVLQNGQEV